MKPSGWKNRKDILFFNFNILILLFKRRPRPSSVFLFSSAVIQLNLYS